MNVIKVLKFILALLKASPRIFIMTVVLPLVAWFKARKAGTPKRYLLKHAGSTKFGVTRLASTWMFNTRRLAKGVELKKM